MPEGIKKAQRDVLDFHDAMDVHVGEHPAEPPEDRVQLRFKLIAEEVKETLEAMLGKEVMIGVLGQKWSGAEGGSLAEVVRVERGDLAEIADGIVDSIYVLLGTAIEYGIDIQPIWDAVQKANMAKVGGEIREDGKRLKPEGWVAPDVQSLIDQQIDGDTPLEDAVEA